MYSLLDTPPRNNIVQEVLTVTITGSGDMAHTVPLVPISMSFEYKSVQSLRLHSTSVLLYQALYSIKRRLLCPSISIQKGL